MPKRIKWHKPPTLHARHNVRIDRDRCPLDYLYGTARWKRLRSSLLARHPLCADPWHVHATQGQTVVAQEIHHVVAAKDDESQFWAASNLMPLCERCHSWTRHYPFPATQGNAELTEVPM